MARDDDSLPAHAPATLSGRNVGRDAVAELEPLIATIAAERARRGWTIMDVACSAGLSHSMVSYVLAGRRSPTLLTMDPLAEAFGWRLELAPNGEAIPARFPSPHTVEPAPLQHRLLRAIYVAAKRLDLSPAELRYRAGLNHNAVHEHRRSGNVKLRTAHKLARAVGMRLILKGITAPAPLCEAVEGECVE